MSVSKETATDLQGAILDLDLIVANPTGLSATPTPAANASGKFPHVFVHRPSWTTACWQSSAGSSRTSLK
jgi:hypothetical protein